MDKPREYWIQKGTPDAIGDSLEEMADWTRGERLSLPVIHVIEMSAVMGLISCLKELSTIELESGSWQDIEDKSRDECNFDNGVDWAYHRINEIAAEALKPFTELEEKLG